MASCGSRGPRQGRGQEASSGGFTGSFGRRLGGLWEAFLRSPGASRGPHRGLLRASRGLLGTPWGVQAASWRPLRGLLGASWGLLWPPLGASWGLLGPLTGLLGASRGPLGGLLGGHGAILGASRAVLDATKRICEAVERFPKGFRTTCFLRPWAFGGPLGPP